VSVGDGQPSKAPGEIDSTPAPKFTLPLVAKSQAVGKGIDGVAQVELRPKKLLPLVRLMAPFG